MICLEETWVDNIRLRRDSYLALLNVLGSLTLSLIFSVGIFLDDALGNWFIIFDKYECYFFIDLFRVSV